jgi:ribosomal protein L11 methyltransferase
MGWLRLTVSSDASHIEDIGALLEQFGAVSLSYTPVTDEPLFDEGGRGGEFWQETAVVALLDEDVDLDILMACIQNRVGREHIHAHNIMPLQDEDWLERYKTGHHPLVFGGRLCVCPGWCEPPPDIEHVIRLDPGLAFGSGSHDTTRLCLEWLAGRDLAGKRVIDYGCGSGILGLAALAMGAEHVQAVDIDAQALLATRENAVRNALSGRITTVRPDSVEGATDLLIANILLNPLLQLAPRFAGLVAHGGDLVLSGLLAHQTGECLAAYRPWFNMQEPRFSNEWAMLRGYRNSRTD